jgi:HK97 family phage prohead protease
MENKDLSILFAEKTAGKDGRRIVAAVSSEAVDRDDEIVSAAAMKAAMTAYMKNPVILAAHTHRTSDGTPTTVGKVTKWWQEDSKTFAEIEFADTPLGQQYHTLYAEKFQRAFSIGFKPIKQERRTIDGKSVVVYTEIDLYEISVVPVPANPEALSKSAKRKMGFVQERRAGRNTYEKIRKNRPDVFLSACEKSDDFDMGRLDGLTQDELIVLRYLEKQGIEYAEALFSLPADYGTSFDDGGKDVDDDEFFDPEGNQSDSRPDYAAIFK